MAYIINKTNGDVLTEVPDSLSDQTTTSLTLFGKDFPLYGEFLNENFIHLLENFAGTTQPTTPLPGQLWFDTSVNQLKVHDGLWFKSTSGVIIAASAPSNIGPGDLWLDSKNTQLYFNDGKQNNLLGPVYTDSQKFSGFRTETVMADDNQYFVIVSMWVGGDAIGVYSTSTFKLATSIYSLTDIGIGFNAVPNSKFLGTASYAESLKDPTTGTAIPYADVINTTKLENRVKIQPIVLSLPCSSMTNDDIISTYIDVLAPPSEHAAGCICRVVDEKGAMKRFILDTTGTTWEFDTNLP